MVSLIVTHKDLTGAAADPTSLVDGPKWDKPHVVSGAENIDNTSDVDKPVSSATQAALNLKANLAGGNTFSGNQSITSLAIGTARMSSPFADNIWVLTGTGSGKTTSIHLGPGPGSLPTGPVTELVLTTTDDQSFGGNYGRWSYTTQGSGFGFFNGIIGEYGGTTAINAMGNFIIQNSIENPPGTQTNQFFLTLRTKAAGSESTQAASIGIGNGDSVPQNKLNFNMFPPTTAGHNDSHSILWEGAWNSGVSSGATWWRQTNQLTSNSGASQFIWQSNLNGAGWNTRAALTDAGAFSVASLALTTPLPASSGGTGIAVLGTGVATALGINTGAAGAFVVNGGPLGTPSSGVATNLTGTAASLTAGNVTTNANLTGDVTSVGNATTLTNAPVIAKVLTGYVSGAGAISAADSILSAFQKLNGNDALKLPLAGGTMTGAIAMGGFAITGGGAITGATHIPSGSTAPTNGMYLPAANTPGIAANGNPALEITNPASAVNFSMLSGAATGVAPYLLATGSDTDVSFFFVTKGAGTMNFSGNSAVTGLNSFARFSAASSAAQNGIWIFGGNSGSGPRLIALDLSGTGNTNVDLSIESSGTGLVKFGTASAFTANGTVATTMTSLGPPGSHTTVQEWLTVKNSAGVIRYIQAF